MMNLTNLGRTGKTADADLLLNKNQIKAMRRLIFEIVRKTIGLTRAPKPLKGFQVDLESVLIWLIREQRLHGLDSSEMELNIKLDGRPFWDMCNILLDFIDQVMVGIVPMESFLSSTQSSKAVYPLAIANCKETRDNLDSLLEDLTLIKKKLISNGLKVDGKEYSFKFTVTADYKALLLCTRKTATGEDVKLGGRGKKWNTEKKFLENCEEIVERSLPISKVKTLFPDKESAEGYILGKVTYCEERIQVYSALLDTNLFIRDNGSDGTEKVSLSENADLINFIQEKHDSWSMELKTIDEKFDLLSGSDNNTDNESDSDSDNERELQEYAASLKINSFKEVFVQWKNIAYVMRDRVFQDGEELEIDMFDLECKEWGCLCREMFGPGLGTGDYGHMVIEHSAMLMRRFRSMGKYSNQGFEAAHKLHRQLYAQCTNHDSASSESSIQQMFVHHYATKLLYVRLCFRQARECVNSDKKKFFFRGCGWPSSNPKPTWSLNDVLWINEINNLLDTILGEDALHYEYDAKINCIVSQEDEPLHVYDHEKWELELEKRMNSTPLSENVHETEEQKPKKPQTKRTKPQTKRCLFPSNAVPQPAQPAPSTLRLCISPAVTR
ncbi:hypothetical protein QZH41_020061 [Actinostola sp. cb2023]|nr:hypothetical protein QZH41_020061 [Actinostola sp. cb2023]